MPKNQNEYKQWDWEKNDREFYKKFYKLPEAQDKKYYNAMKEHRYNINGFNQKLDLRPRIFVKTMKVEIIIFLFGVGFAIGIINY